MAKIVTSARGEKIDFDLFMMKQTMASAPQTEQVRKRERFINKKRRRGMKKKVDEMAQAKILNDKNFDAAIKSDERNAERNNTTEVELETVESDDATEPKTRRKVK